MSVLELGKEHPLASKLNIDIELNHGLHKEAIDDIRPHEIIG